MIQQVRKQNDGPPVSFLGTDWLSPHIVAVSLCASAKAVSTVIIGAYYGIFGVWEIKIEFLEEVSSISPIHGGQQDLAEAFEVAGPQSPAGRE